MRRELEGTVLALIGTFIYGIEPVVIKSNPTNPVGFAALSALIASLVLWTAALWDGGIRELRDDPSGIKRAFLVGLFGTALAYLAYSFGTRMSTAINAALLTRSEVLWSFLLSWLFLGERITARLIGYALFLLVGLSLVITQGRPVQPMPGDALLLLVPLFWQMGHVMAKGLPYRPTIIAALRNTFGFLLLLPLAAATGMEPSPFIVVEGLVIAFGQLVWYRAIKLINLSKATAIITPAPAVAMAAGVLLGEPLTVYHLVGFVLITAGTLGVIKVESARSGGRPL
ncbi:DMT family transporter [Thermococcus sp. MV11]|uniref:DMT family transporter n=1 Tax=Thermococcus sp. MV11 TaxID=1638267 RepID=UPI0014320392|nr:DMT family transporter [Thermococcus sp. MV11]NJE02977.1 DMT family transporter [Thermococcus sp. MV11]